MIFYILYLLVVAYLFIVAVAIVAAIIKALFDHVPWLRKTWHRFFPEMTDEMRAYHDQDPCP